jgi:hypothetical protein
MTGWNSHVKFSPVFLLNEHARFVIYNFSLYFLSKVLKSY